MLPEIKKCADNGDIRGLRYIFDDCLDVDPTFEKYKDGWEYCQSVGGLIEPHKELTPFEFNSSRWDEDYWLKLKSDLIKNFSTERFDHMIDVAKVYYAEKIIRLETERTNARKDETPKQSVAAVPSSEVNSIQESKAAADARILAQQQLREQQIAERRKKEQAQRDVQFETEQKQRADERKRKEQEESTKKIVGVAVIAIAIIVVAVILLIK